MEEKTPEMKNYTLISFLAVLVSLSACKQKFDPINYGHEACTHCRMTIVDKRFAAEIVTGKGKTLKFDDFGCLLKYVKDEKFKDTSALIFVADFNHPDGKFLDARHTVFVHDENLRSPMNGNFAALNSEAGANKLNAGLHGTLLTWTSLRK
jgi:copper chaperone NosL